MSGWITAFVTYVLTIIIAFFCAGMIHLLVLLMQKRSSKEVNGPKDRAAKENTPTGKGF